MKYPVFNYFPAFLLAVCTLFASCKEDTILNSSLVPVDDTINTIIVPDSITILSRTFFDDSLITSYTVSGLPVFHALGSSVNDPYTGKTNASIYFQIVPPALNYTFPADPDSAVLVLPYAYFTWGDTASIIPQTFNVYEVTDSLFKDSTYYSKTDKAVDKSNLLGTATITSFHSIKDSVLVDTVLQPPHLRIKLSAAFINKIKAGATLGDNFKAFGDFTNWFKGLYIEPANPNSGNALFYFSISGDADYYRAGVLFYYKDAASGTEQVAPFPFNSSYTAHYNKISRDFSGTPIGTLIASTNATDSVMIIENEPGAVADLKMPFIKNLPKQPLNKAELIITQYSFAGDNADKYFPPERIYPVGINSTGGTYTILDRYPTTSAEPLLFMDGTRKTITVGPLTVSQYTLNIPREVQKAIVEGRDTLHLRISGASTLPAAYRVITSGSSFSNTTTKVKLKLVYSKI